MAELNQPPRERSGHTSRSNLPGIFVLTMVAAAVAIAGVGPPAADAIWADGDLYATVGTPSNLPDRGPKDGLFVFSGLEGQRPVSESKPGDSDHNGGRRQVYALDFTDDGVAVHDPDGNGVADFELTGWEMVQHHIALGHLPPVDMGPSFVCPLVQR